MFSDECSFGIAEVIEGEVDEDKGEWVKECEGFVIEVDTGHTDSKDEDQDSID